MKTKIAALAALTVVLGAGAASAQPNPYLADGKGNQAGGYRGYIDRQLGRDSTGTIVAPGAAPRVNPYLADGKGNQAGGYRGYVDRRLGRDSNGTIVDPGPAVRVNPYLADGKGNQAGGYRGYYERRGVDVDDTGTVPAYGPGYRY
jgi:hypothetical protein